MILTWYQAVLLHQNTAMQNTGMPVSWAGVFNYKYVLQTSGEELGWVEAGEAVIYKKYMGKKASSKAEIKRFMKNEWNQIVDNSHSGYNNMHD